MFKNIEDVWSYLGQIPMFSKVGVSASNFELDNIRNFCSLIGNPQDQIKTIHVAGTNGKGTVTLLLESIYRSAGFKTGAFTSPHLLKYNERVKISGKDISDEKMLEFFQRHVSELNTIPLTYFEISTALAFWAFADEKVDIAIIEAGLGGRLDSTNIIVPECSVITSIGLDHQAILGNTRAEIAREKAGIVKANIPVVLGNIEGAELIEIQRIAQNKNAVVKTSMDLDPRFKSGFVSLKHTEQPLKTNFIEPINAFNVTTALSVIDTLQSKLPVTNSIFISSLKEFPGVPARFEKLLPDAEWYFSGAHNPESVQSLAEGLERFKGRNVNIVLSMMKDKINKEVLHPFGEFPSIYFYEQKIERSARFEQISKYLDVESIDESTFKRILHEMKLEVVIFAGSFYFYAIVKRWLTHLN